MKKFFLSLVMFFAFCSNLVAKDIQGFWKIMDEKTGEPRCMVAVYEYLGKHYGRIVATYNKDGEIEDTIYKPKGRAPGIIGDPFYAGLDLIWDLVKGGSHFDGKIVDPRKGNIYNCELWIKGGDLIVRGKLFVFGRNQTWLAALESDFTPTFKKPDVKKFVPVVPQVK